MTVFDIEYALEHMTLIVDTREQDTMRARKRLKETGYPYIRQKLDFGDYSAKVTMQDGEEITFSSAVCIERKMSLDELAACFCRGRSRFEREFERAAAAGAKTYLLIENGSFEKLYTGDYRTKMTPKAFRASLLAWLARYNCQLIFCEPKNSGKLIGEILYREVKERLTREQDS